MDVREWTLVCLRACGCFQIAERHIFLSFLYGEVEEQEKTHLLRPRVLWLAYICVEAVVTGTPGHVRVFNATPESGLSETAAIY